MENSSNLDDSSFKSSKESLLSKNETLFEIPHEMLIEINNFFSNKNIYLSNKYLNDYIKLENFEAIVQMLFQSSEINIKFFCAESLIKLFTENSYQISNEKTLFIYKKLLFEIFDNGENYFINYSYFLNILIKLLCRIIRLNWYNDPSVKKINIDIMTLTANSKFLSYLLPYKIFKELIYQFQSIENYSFPAYHKVRLQKVISNFKDSILQSIFEQTIQTLYNIFQRQIQIDKIEEYFLVLNELFECLFECMDYEEDINSKEDYYSKYEIKPAYIPNGKKRSRDKSLDIKVLCAIVQSLFENYNMLIKYNEENNLNGKNNQLCNPAFCLLLLQKFCTMKIIYLGDKKESFLKVYQDNICNILFKHKGFIHCEELCKLIYYLKKNFTIIELSVNEVFLNEYTFDYCKQIINNLIQKKSFPCMLNGLTFLFRFFGYFSHSIEVIYPKQRENIVNFIREALSNFIDKFDINYYFEDGDLILFEDLSKSFGICGECIFSELLDKISSNLEHNIKKNKYYIMFGIDLIKNVYQIILEKKLKSKADDEIYNPGLDNFSDSVSINCEETLEVKSILNYIKIVFKIINNIIILENDNAKDNLLKDQLFIFSILVFIKYFIKNFLDEQLETKFLDVICNMNDILNLHNLSDFIIYLYKLLHKISLHYDKNEIYIYQNLQKCLRYLVTKFKNNFDDIENNVSKLSQSEHISLGKMKVSSDILIPLLIDLYKNIINSQIEPNLFNDFLSSIFQVLFISTMSKEKHIKNICNYIIKSSLQIEKKINSLNSLINIINERNEYEILFNELFDFLDELQLIFCNNNDINEQCISILNLLLNLTNNFNDRINLSPNSQVPYKLLNTSKNILTHYYKLANNISNISNENMKYKLQINPISIIIKIFNNLFNCIQISLLVNMDFNYIQSIFNYITDLIFSMSDDDIFCYINQFQNIFSILSKIYSDYIHININICPHKYIHRIICLIYQYFEFINPELKYLIFGIEQILCQWINYKLNNLNNIFMSTIFDNEENINLLQKILDKIFSFITEDNNIFNECRSEFTHIAFSLICLFKDYYVQLSSNFINNDLLNINEKESLRIALNNLLIVINNNDKDLVKAFILFKSSFTELSRIIKNIIIEHTKE